MLLNDIVRVATYLSIIVFFLQSGQNICRSSLSQVIGLQVSSP